MAKLTKNGKYIVEMYVRYFGKTPTKAQIDEYAEVGKQKEILKQIMGDANDAKPSNITYDDYIDSIFQNLFGRPASGPEKTKYAKTYDKEGVLPINAIVKAAKSSDKAVYQTKNAVALLIAEEGSTTNFDLDKITKDTYKEIYNPKTKKFVGTLAEVKTIVDAMKDNVTGQTFNLTASADNFVGKEKGDVFNSGETFLGLNGAASVYGSNLNSLDVLDGGAGKDTLNVVTEGAIATVTANISNIETINLKSGAGVTFDTTTFTGVETLNATKGTSATLTAAATTDVNVSGITGATSVTGGDSVIVSQDINVDLSDVDGSADSVASITVNGAKDVTITANKSLYKVTTDGGATDTDLGIVVGGATAVTGAVKITSTGDALKGNDNGIKLDDISVTGGTTVEITQVAAASYGDSASKNAGGNDTVTQGAITVDATTATTTVTVKQDAAVSAVNAANTTGAVTETASVKFGALKVGDKLTIEVAGGTADTIDTGEFTLTAVKDMSATEVAAAFANLINGSAYGSLIAAGDTQSGAAFTKGTYTGLDTLWTSAAASGDTVVFTSNTANNTVADIDFFLTNTSTNSVAPIVTTTQGKGHDATMAGGVTGIVAGKVDITANTALTTVTVDSYGATSNINGAAAALATINLKNGAAFTVSDTADTVTLTLEKVTGATTFTAGSEPKTLNVKSIGDNKGVIAAANTTAFNVSGTGTLTQAGSLAAVKNITVTETAGLNLTSATLTALESIDATATTGAVTASISGTQTTYAGSKGVDTLIVSNAGTAVAKAIDLGAGNDKLILAGGTVSVPTVELKGGEGTDTLSIDAASAVTLSGATAFAAKLNSFERLEITGATSTQSVDVKKLGFANYVTVAGVSANGTLTLNDLANNATVVLNATTGTGGLTTNIKDASTGETDVLNLVVTNDSGIAAGTVTAANIETINLTVTDVFVDLHGNEPTNNDNLPNGKDDNDATHTMTLTADKATALTIDGNAGLTLTLTNASKLVTIDASKMTEGGLTVTANGANAMTITGGAGADVLTASTGATAKADILVGGAGNDILTAGSNGAKLTGGAGNDLFILTATSATTGTKEATTHSYITDFKAGDLLQLEFRDNTDVTTAAVTGFAKLAANQSANAVYSDYVNAAMSQLKDAAAEGEAVWFSFAGNSYVVVDSGIQTTGTFKNGEDLVIELTGVANLNGASFNSDFGTIAL